MVQNFDSHSQSAFLFPKIAVHVQDRLTCACLNNQLTLSTNVFNNFICRFTVSFHFIYFILSISTGTHSISIMILLIYCLQKTDGKWRRAYLNIDSSLNALFTINYIFRQYNVCNKKGQYKEQRVDKYKERRNISKQVKQKQSINLKRINNSEQSKRRI